MKDELVQVDEHFWNVRGSFKIAKLLDVGTQMSLLRRNSGDFVLLDSYTLQGEVRDQVLSLTDGGKAVSAILNLHPFHTLHVRSAASQFPHARLYGTRRHVEKASELRWESCRTEDPKIQELFAEDLTFSVPRGVDFIPENQNLHFASVLALHKASKTLHVDDTLTWVTIPLLGGLKFHPSLPSVLQKRAGAVKEFRSWLQELTDMSPNVEHLCTAHMRQLPTQQEPLSKMLQDAISNIEKTLAAHERRYG